MRGRTPGPWRVGKAGAIVSGCPSDCMGQEHEEFYGGHFVCESVSGSDALLIAAAPDLLEALRTIGYEPIGPSDASPEVMLSEIAAIARAAIAKAGGRP